TNNTPLDVYPHLGGVFPSGGPTQSLLRLYNVYNGNTVRVSLYDGATGDKVLTWTSPNIPVGTTQQFSIADLDSAALPGFKKPAFYSLKVENFAGPLQHVLFNPDAGVITNASSCGGGVSGNPDPLIGVHSSQITAYPSTLVFANAYGVPGIFPTLYMLNA